ncbi:MAG: hypothetical protein PHC47_03085, partial [Clostridia bacterium]|nr:hypothetical protein [Clostridia bacterium]
ARLSFRMLEIVLIDDIFENLKQEEQEVLKEIIKKNYVGKSILILATQDEKIAKELCKRKIFFKSGSIEKND